MDRQQFLLHFSFLDFRSCISEAQYLIDVPASLSLDDVQNAKSPIATKSYTAKQNMSKSWSSPKRQS